MSSQFDVAIIGGGPAAIFAAYELTLKNPCPKVALVEAGQDIYNRRCPIAEKKVSQKITAHGGEIRIKFVDEQELLKIREIFK